MESAACLPNRPTPLSRIKTVGSFEELVATPFAAGLNAMCWARTLPGDFREVVRCLGPGEGIVSVAPERLQNLSLSPAGEVARVILLEDLARLRAHDLEPSLDCVYQTPRDESGGPVPTDVLSFHADSATVPADTYLCSYTEASSEGLPNEEAIRSVDLPEIRAQLLEGFGGDDDEGFAEYLNDHFYDLHYAPISGAKPYSFGLGNLWRIATDYPGSPVLPCIHRAPTPPAGAPPRLLLIS